jgi:hypothetical protein
MRKLIIPLLIAILSLNNCREDAGVKRARMVLKLTDSPANYQEVNIDFQSAEVHISGGAGWVTLKSNAGIYNLLDLTNGIDTVIASADLPAGKISQLRLILGPNNSIKDNGQLYPLETPSSQQSGLKLNIHAELIDGVTYTLLLDFDAARSVIKTGNGKYQLKPVIRTLTDPLDGAISGSVTPVSSIPAIFAITGTDTTGTFPDAMGNFLIRGLVAGTYDVLFMPVLPNTDTTVTGIVVIKGQVTPMGTIPMP